MIIKINVRYIDGYNDDMKSVINNYTISRGVYISWITTLIYIFNGCQILSSTI